MPVSSRAQDRPSAYADNEQIGDLLAQISSGEKGSAPAAARLPTSSSSSIKRKAETDAPRNRAIKSPRVSPPPRFTGTSRPSTTKPTSSQRPGNPTSAQRPGSTADKPRPAAAADKAAPKKGSFAEILARAQRAQATMGQVGKIQHKKVEAGPRLTREEMRERKAPAGKKRAPAGYSGTGKSTGVSKRPGAPTSKDPRAAPRAGSSKKAPPAEPEKKVKKAASATTGYTGTARPKPGNPTKKTHAPRGGALLNAPRHNGSSRGRYDDDYDEELDDFIEYDDDEGEGAGYGYASDGSSDMEAGLDDIDGEERMAERMARAEDDRERKLEARLRAEKEERRRQFERR